MFGGGGAAAATTATALAATALATAVTPAALLVPVSLASGAFWLFAASTKGGDGGKQHQVKSMYPLTQQLKMTDLCFTENPGLMPWQGTNRETGAICACARDSRACARACARAASRAAPRALLVLLFLLALVPHVRRRRAQQQTTLCWLSFPAKTVLGEPICVSPLSLPPRFKLPAGQEAHWHARQGMAFLGAPQADFFWGGSAGAFFAQGAPSVRRE